MKKPSSNKKIAKIETLGTAALATPTDLKAKAITAVSESMNLLLADVFAMYLKTKNFHWHVSGPHFRDYHIMLDEQAEQIYDMADPIAERIRKLGGSTLRSIGHIAKLQRISDNDALFVNANDMLLELCDDNKILVENLREVHEVCADHKDFPSSSLIENWIDETERRIWFLFEATRQVAPTGSSSKTLNMKA